MPRAIIATQDENQVSVIADAHRVSSLSEFYAESSRKAFWRGDADAPSFEQLVNELHVIVHYGKALRENIIECKALLSEVDEFPNGLAEEWIKEANGMQKNSDQTRSVAAEARQAIDHSPKPSVAPHYIFLSWYSRLADHTDELADMMEDLAETMALAAHQPFRDQVNAQLKDVGVA